MSTTDDAIELETRRRYELIGMLGRTFNRPTDELLLEAYHMATADIALPDLERAVARALIEASSMPFPKQLRILAGTDVSGENRAILAFEALAKLVSREGAYRSVLTDDPILNATINSCGGWEAVCEVPNDEWHSHFRHRFLKTYGANLESKRGTMQPQLGIADKQNTANGYEMSKPTLFVTGLPNKVACITSDHPAVANALIEERASLIGRIDN